jgi:hypothetical protein
VRHVTALAFFTLAFPIFSQGFRPPSAEEQAVLRAASELDHQKMMDLLKIDKLRRGADGRDPKAENYANYGQDKKKHLLVYSI